MLKELTGVLSVLLIMTSSPSYGKKIKGDPKHSGIVLVKTSNRSRGTAFFITPNTLVTAFHNIRSLYLSEGLIKKHISFYTIKNKLISRYPISLEKIEIIALDGKYDLAVLKIKGYKSKTFYPIRSFKKTSPLPRDSNVLVMGFPGRNFTLFRGTTLGNVNYAKEGGFEGFGHDRYAITKGASGAPVFLSDHSLAGVYIEGRSMYPDGPIGLDLFTSVLKLKEILSQRTSLACFNFSCVEEEVQNVLNQAKNGDRLAQYKMAVFDFDGRQLFWFEKAALNGHPNAQFFWGKHLFHVESNTYWIEKSAAQNHLPALDYLRRIEANRE